MLDLKLDGDFATFDYDYKAPCPLLSPAPPLCTLMLTHHCQHEQPLLMANISRNTDLNPPQTP